METTRTAGQPGNNTLLTHPNSCDNTESPTLDSSPIYTFEEFLKCDFDDEELEIKGKGDVKANKLQNPTQNFYDNTGFDTRDEERKTAAIVSSSRGQQSSLVGHYTNQPNGTESVGFYVINDRYNRISYDRNDAHTSTDHRPGRSIASSSVSGGREEVRSTEPRILCASSLATEQLENKPPPTERRGCLHPILRRAFKSVLYDLFCCCKKSDSTTPKEESEQRRNMCSKCLCCFRSQLGSQARAEQYRMTDTAETTNQQPIQRFSWERERPPAQNYKFSGIEDKVMVKRKGDICGQQFIIENCQNSVLLVLDALDSVTIDDCKSCVIVLGPCSGSVFIRDCTDCTVYTACQQFRSRDCSIMVHLFCATKPIIEETTAQFYPLYLQYPFIWENMTQSGLSPFTNYWYEIHNFTPDTTQFIVSEKLKPIGQVYGPVHDWLPDLKQERVSIDKIDSFLLNIPMERKLGSGEERVLVLFNQLPPDGNQKTLSLSSFYSTTVTVVQRLCFDPEVARLLMTHDLTLKPGELNNIFGKKTPISEGKIISVELAGPLQKCRQFISSFLEPVNYPGIQVQILSSEQTDSYGRNLDRLADVQSSI